MTKQTKLNPVYIKQIVKLVKEEGTSPVNAAKAVMGVDKTTFWKWRERGRGEARGIYRELEDELQRAEVRPVVVAENVVFKSMSSPNEVVALKAAIFVLQNKDKENYGAQKTLNIGNVDNQPFQTTQLKFDLSKMNDNQLAAYEKYLETLTEPTHDDQSPDETNDESDPSSE